MFRRTQDTLFYIFQDFAFLPCRCLLVTLVLNDLLGRSERSLLHQKLNMGFGAFFTEVGDDLLRRFAALDANVEREMRRANASWSLGTSSRTISPPPGGSCPRVAPIGWTAPHARARGARIVPFVDGASITYCGLLENPNLLEHASFTDLLWAVSHLTEELLHRSDLADGPARMTWPT